MQVTIAAMMCGHFVRGRARHAPAVRLFERYQPANPEDVVREMSRGGWVEFEEARGALLGVFFDTSR